MSEKSKEYKRLLAKRATYVRALEYLVPKVNELNNEASQVNIITRLTQIEASYEKFTNVTNEIELDNDFESKDLDPITEEVVEKYISMASKLNALKKEIPSSALLDSSLSTLIGAPLKNTQSEALNVKFPPMPIPTFNGSYEEWPTFRDNWKMMVDKQSNMPDVVKMHFLKTNLTGQALPVISKLPVTEASYQAAWELLYERFENKRSVSNAGLKKFINVSQINKPNAKTLRAFIDESKISLQCIEAIGVNISSWDAIIVHIMQSKLDSDTLKAWETHLKGTKELPTYEQMLDRYKHKFENAEKRRK